MKIAEQSDVIVRSFSQLKALHKLETCLPKLSGGLLSNNSIDKQGSVIDDSDQAVVREENNEEEDVAQI